MRVYRWIGIGLLVLAGTTPCYLKALGSPEGAFSASYESSMDREGVDSQLAPGALGTRSNTPMRSAAPSGNSYAWLQLTLALVLVALGLRYGLPRLIGWAGKAGIGSRLDGEIRLLESRAVPGGSLLMVKARDRLLLIGATPQGMQLLADLTTTSQDEPARSGFEQILRRAAAADAKSSMYRRGAPQTDLQHETESELQAHIEQARARLARMVTGGRKP